MGELYWGSVFYLAKNRVQNDILIYLHEAKYCFLQETNAILSSYSMKYLLSIYLYHMMISWNCEAEHYNLCILYLEGKKDLAISVS